VPFPEALAAFHQAQTAKTSAVLVNYLTELSQSEILHWLKEYARPLHELYTWADAVRKQSVGNAVHLRA